MSGPDQLPSISCDMSAAMSPKNEKTTSATPLSDRSAMKANAVISLADLATLDEMGIVGEGRRKLHAIPRLAAASLLSLEDMMQKYGSEYYERRNRHTTFGGGVPAAQSRPKASRFVLQRGSSAPAIDTSETAKYAARHNNRQHGHDHLLSFNPGATASTSNGSLSTTASETRTVVMPSESAGDTETETLVDNIEEEEEYRKSSVYDTLKDDLMPFLPNFKVQPGDNGGTGDEGPQLPMQFSSELLWDLSDEERKEALVEALSMLAPH